MKKIVKITTGICVLLLLFSCEKEEIRTPKVVASINKDRLAINETMIIDFTGSIADQIVVFPGDNMQNYELRDQSNTGVIVNKKLFNYAFQDPGEYKVVCLASTAGEMATNLRFDTCSFTVTVIDDATEINKLSCYPMLMNGYDEIFAKRYPDDEWFVVLPRNLKYNGRTQNVDITRRYLGFYTQSNTTKIFINGNLHSTTTVPLPQYNLSVPLNIVAKSHFGTERPYTLYTINYPEFNSFMGVNRATALSSGAIELNEYDYSRYVWNITLAVGTDVSKPVFTTFSPLDKVYIGDVEQISGVSEVDFTNEVIYRLVSNVPDKPEMQAETTIAVKIKFQ